MRKITPNELFALHQLMCYDARNLMMQKNADYTAGSEDALANFRDSEIVGVRGELGILMRVIDKIKRLQSFINSGTMTVANESASDACTDILNYMVLLNAFIIERDLPTQLTLIPSPDIPEGVVVPPDYVDKK